MTGSEPSSPVLSSKLTSSRSLLSQTAANSNRSRFRSATDPGPDAQNSSGVHEPVRRLSSITKDDYLKRLLEHSQKTSENALYLGRNFEKLVDFMCRVDSPLFEKPEAQLPSPAYATLYSLQVKSGPGPSQEQDSWDFTDPEDLIFKDKNLCSKFDRGPGNQLLFLRGFPSPQWLRTLGAHYVVDPEFFRRHLDMSLFSHQQWFSKPSLPSTSNTIIRLRITTLASGSRGIPNVVVARKTLDEEMTNYVRSMSGQVLRGDLGESIVRKMSLHNEQYFSLEQDISINFCKRGKYWTVIIWLDSGKDFNRCRPGPWGREFEMKPTIRNEPNKAIHASKSVTGDDKIRARAKEFHYSRALLNLGYDRLLESHEHLDDAFFCIIPVFNFKATAESQFLNLVESILSKSLGDIPFIKSIGEGNNKDRQYFVDLGKHQADFSYHKELLETHSRSLADSIRWIKNRGGPLWPRSKSKKVEDAVETLLEDFEWLERRAQSLSDLCDRAMKDIHDKSTLAEAWKANEQARQVNQLTTLAYFMSVFYIPLSFTSGIFGMNFAIFGQGDVSLWYYAIVSIPILAFSVVFMFRRDLWGKLSKFRRRSTSNKATYAVNDPQSMAQV